MDIDKKVLWRDVLATIKISVSPAIFSTWFSQTHLAEITDLNKRVVAEIGCNSAFIKNTIENRYFGLIQDTLNKALGKPCDLSFVVKTNPEQTTFNQEGASPLFAETKNKNEVFLNALNRAKIRPGFSFENFAVSSSNQMAHAAAEAVAQNPGTAYNPLFIWGGVGVGKTHLMLAVGHAAIQKNPEIRVLSCTGESFTNDIIEGIRNKTTPTFRNKYRKLALLLLDDIQFLAGKDTAQEEFFHTFNAVTSSGGQIILTSDRPPSEIAKLEERLRSRFEAGLIVDIAPPDFELRCAITQIKARERNIPLQMEQVQMIAANLDSARKIEGSLIKLLTLADPKKMDITNEQIEKIIGKGIETNGRVVKKNPAEVTDIVCQYYQIGKRSILGDSRTRPLARPRQVLMYLLRTHLGLSLEETGRLVGGRDHTTVMHAVEKVTQLAITDVHIREDISKLKLGI
jgi:chromosomal replication initiator protein